MEKKHQNLDQLCEMIRANIAKSDISAALEGLKELTEQIGDNGYKMQLIAIEFRYNHYKKEEIGGRLNAGEASPALNAIVGDILQFLQGLDVQQTLKENHKKIDDIQSSITQLNARLSLNIEIAKERITKLGECWTAMYVFENKLFRIVEDFLTCLLQEEKLDAGLMEKLEQFGFKKNLDNLYNLLSDTNLNQILQTCDLSHDEYTMLLQNMEIAFEDYFQADLTLEKNKFWLGYDIYEEARKYHDCYPIFLKEYKAKKYTGCLRCLSYQRDAMGSIESTIKHFQNRYFGD